jgi:peptidyl-prolyl cis-trans isomerase C
VDTIARINDVALHRAGEMLPADALRQRACSELLRQAAMAAGLLDRDDPPPEDGAVSEAASAAIEALLDREIAVPEPSDEACRRHHAAHPARYAVGERALLRHVLFAVTPGVDVTQLRRRAEACLIDLRAPVAREGDLRAPVAREGDLRAPVAREGDLRAGDGSDRFAQVAAQTSNCPSGQDGGALGWLTAADCAPEFAREIFGHAEVGVLARLVHSRFGLHVVEVLARQRGEAPAFESVRAAVAQSLRQQAFATALRQYLQLLAGQADVQGVELDAAATPLVQ